MLVRHGTDMRDVMFGHDDTDEMYGYGGNDDLWGDGGNDLLHGGDGDDKLVGGEGADLLDGGDGTDLASYEDAKAGVYVRLDTGAGYAGSATGDTLIGIENLRGTIYADILVGDGNGNRIEGGAGDDVIFGLGGIDLLYGGAGNDHLWGGADWDYIYGGTGFDYVRYDYAPDRVDVRLEHPLLTGTGGGWAGEAFGDSFWEIEGVVGSNFDDHIEGTNPAGALIDGVNVLIGLGGNDEIFGLGGNDTLYGGDGADLLDGGAGFDYARYDDSSASVYVSLEAGFGYTGAALNDRLVGVEGLVGSNYGDTLIGDAGVNALFGGSGDDVLIGGLGGDFLAGDAGFDVVSYAGAASSVAVNLATGGTVGDAFGDIFDSIESVIGSGYADTLIGNSDDNVLRGAAGGDTLTGGSGNDQFVFDRADLFAERDIITDFATTAGNTDTLVFRGLAAGEIALTDDPSGVRISVLDPTFGGDILVLGVTSAQLSGHLLFV
jgi:Ca2+-binding RTX toxin-like protein